jgi:lysophospholipase L1-like esterase
MKIIILTESAGNPRSFPIEDKTELEDTYPYLLKNKYNEAVFWQLSFGNITTEELISQACGYLTHWNPDLIIVHSGMNDCRPEAFTDFQKYIISNFSGRLFTYLKKFINNPKLINYRKVYRVSPKRFSKSMKKLKMIFNDSKIFWLEICADKSYEISRPGVLSRIDKYNNILKNFYKDDFVEIQSDLTEKNGFTTDKIHLNVNGHKIIANKLIEKITSLNLV